MRSARTSSSLISIPISIDVFSPQSVPLFIVDKNRQISFQAFDKRIQGLGMVNTRLRLLATSYVNLLENIKQNLKSDLIVAHWPVL